jgi:hypothetical protein
VLGMSVHQEIFVQIFATEAEAATKNLSIGGIVLDSTSSLRQICHISPRLPALILEGCRAHSDMYAKPDASGKRSVIG